MNLNYDKVAGTNLGQLMACVDKGETLKSSSDTELTVVTDVLKMASALFDDLEDTSTCANAYRLMSKQAELGEGGLAHKAAAMEFLEALDQQDTLKKAFGPMDLAKTAIGTVPSAWQTLMGGGVLTGSSLGALYWWLNRHARESDMDIETAMNRRDHFRRVADETKRRIQRRIGRRVDNEEIDPREVAYESAHEALNTIAPK